MMIFIYLQEKTFEGTLINLLGFAIIIFCVLVVSIVSKQSFKRLNRPEDQMLLTDTQTE